MKRVILKTLFAITVSASASCSVTYAQSISSALALNSSTSAFGAQQGVTQSATIGLPGSFGGPGVTGAAMVEYSNTNVFNQFSNNTSTGGGTGSGMGGTGTTGSSFGGGTSGGMGMGSMGMGGMGGLGMGMGMRGIGGMGGFGAMGGLGGRGQLGGTGANARNQIRAVVRPDIEVNPAVIQASRSNVASRLERLPLPSRLPNVTATLNGDVVTLTGSVPRDSDKRMAGRLVMMEPGVQSVQNDLVVQNPDPIR